MRKTTCARLLVVSAFVLRCGPGHTGFGEDGGLADAAIDAIGAEAAPPDAGPTTYADFPAASIVDGSLPSTIGSQFGVPNSGSGAAPCIAEPASDAMIPKNWTPLFVEYSGPGANVYEIRVAIDNQQNTAIVYTPSTTYTFDQSVWKSVESHSAGHDVIISLRAGVLTNGHLASITAESTSTVNIAPVDAPGSVVYWSSTGGTSFKGFTVGDMTSKSVLNPSTASPSSTGAGDVVCISCHTSSPDGSYVFYTRDTGPDGRPRGIDARTVVGASPPSAADISPSALALLARSVQGAPAFSPAHYSASDAVALSLLYDTSSTHYDLVWTDLHATGSSGSGVIERSGDENAGIASLSWRHDGSAIAYVSSTSAGEGAISLGPTMDIYTVPYGDKAGGTAKQLAGASDASYHEYYPVYSPNDTMLAFDRTPSSCNYGPDQTQQCGSSYNQVAAELYVVPGGGGTAQRLRANDPPACTTLASPGLTNSWARWAPQAQSFGEYNYYWIVFSSKRRSATGLIPQLYVAALVTKVSGGSETITADYPAVYVLSQDPTQNNHTPAWDNFKVQGIPN